MQRIVELKNKEITNLKQRLDKSREVGWTQHQIEKSARRGGLDDSEKDTSYSLHQHLSDQADLTEIQQAVANISWEDYTLEMNNTNHAPAVETNTPPMVTTENQSFDPFSVFPPVPPLQRNFM